jgi:hypothetical protein
MRTEDALLLNQALEKKGVPALVVNKFTSLRRFSRFAFSKGSRAILNEPNAGGSSEMSEAASYELLHRQLGFRLLKTEMQIQYEWVNSKKTDYCAKLFNDKFGVSVTRAMRFDEAWTGKKFTREDAVRLLTRKLYGIIMSNQDVSDDDRWAKQMLHIWTYDQYIIDLLVGVYNKLDPQLKSDTVVLVTLAPNSEFIFTNRDTAVQKPKPRRRRKLDPMARMMRMASVA